MTFEFEGKKVTVQNFRLFSVKYIGATNTLGARIKITDERNGKNVTMARNCAAPDCVAQAASWLQKNGIKILGYGEIIKGAGILITANFETQIG
jgi:hypothetical protein